MFGSTILDVAIGLVFLFLAVSLAASAITEVVASAVKLRHTTLRKGIGALLNDPQFTGLARLLYNHALINPLGSGQARTVAELTSSPAYISGRAFALVLVDALRQQEDDRAQAADTGGAPPESVWVASPAGQDLATLVDAVGDPQLKALLSTLLAEAGGREAEFLDAVGRWFDDAMARLSGWYKRYTQLISAAVAFAVAFILNADALRIGGALWRTPALTAELRVANGDQVTAAIQALDKAGLLGWSTFADPRTDLGGFVLMVLGWLIVAGAAVFGAPFWFDTLQRFTRLAGTGPAGTAQGGPPV